MTAAAHKVRSLAEESSRLFPPHHLTLRSYISRRSTKCRTNRRQKTNEVVPEGHRSCEYSCRRERSRARPRPGRRSQKHPQKSPAQLTSKPRAVPARRPRSLQWFGRALRFRSTPSHCRLTLQQRFGVTGSQISARRSLARIRYLLDLIQQATRTDLGNL